MHVHKRTVCCFFVVFLPVSREKYLFKNRTNEVPPNSYYHSLYPKIIQDIEVSIHLLLLSIRVTCGCVSFLMVVSGVVIIYTGV